LLAEESNAFVIQSMLKFTGVNILLAVNGISAIEICKQEPSVSLVLMAKSYQSLTLINLAGRI
jgi:CheY-like chemotaxis protein